MTVKYSDKENDCKMFLR